MPMARFEINGGASGTGGADRRTVSTCVRSHCQNTPARRKFWKREGGTEFSSACTAPTSEAWRWRNPGDRLHPSRVTAASLSASGCALTVAAAVAAILLTSSLTDSRCAIARCWRPAVLLVRAALLRHACGAAATPSTVATSMPLVRDRRSHVPRWCAGPPGT